MCWLHPCLGITWVAIIHQAGNWTHTPLFVFSRYPERWGAALWPCPTTLPNCLQSEWEDSVQKPWKQKNISENLVWNCGPDCGWASGGFNALLNYPHFKLPIILVCCPNELMHSHGLTQDCLARIRIVQTITFFFFFFWLFPHSSFDDDDLWSLQVQFLGLTLISSLQAAVAKVEEHTL